MSTPLSTPLPWNVAPANTTFEQVMLPFKLTVPPLNKVWPGPMNRLPVVKVVTLPVDVDGAGVGLDHAAVVERVGRNGARAGSPGLDHGSFVVESRPAAGLDDGNIRGQCPPPAPGKLVRLP